MTNQFYDTLNYSPLEIVCFKQIELSFDRKTLCDIRYNGNASFASWWGESALGLFYL